jgi:hypothetical protein
VEAFSEWMTLSGAALLPRAFLRADADIVRLGFSVSANISSH